MEELRKTSQLYNLIEQSTEFSNYLKIDPFHPIEDHSTLPDEASLIFGIEAAFLKYAQTLKMDQADGVLFVTDSQGSVIRVFGSLPWPSEIGFLPGKSLKLASAGTNAAGIALDYGVPAVVSGEQHWKRFLYEYTTLALPVRANDQTAVVLGCVTPGKEGRDSLIQPLQTLAAVLEHLLFGRWQSAQLAELRREYDKLSKEKERHQVLLRMTKTLHSHIDIDFILSEAVGTIGKLYPELKIDIFLSHDNPNSSLPIKPLNYNEPDEDICIRSFMQGKTFILSGSPSDSPKSKGTELAVPLRGHQGVYGVLHLHSPEPVALHPDEISFLSILAETAGSALENARLYEQSNDLINELRVINEITQRLNQSLKPKEIFEYASSQIVKTFGADYCCIAQLDESTNEMMVTTSNIESLVGRLLEAEESFAGFMRKTKEAIIISDYAKSSPVKSPMVESGEIRSLMGSPIITNNEVVGAILVADRRPNAFSYESFKLLQILSQHIGFAIKNAYLHAEVKRMVITDNLTGLHVRHYLDEQIAHHQQTDTHGTLLLMDIDHFKNINDTYGHQVGDNILRKVSAILKANIRETDVAARWGGEEMAIYFPLVSTELALVIAERIRSRVQEESEPKVTISCGIATWTLEDETISVESLFRRADTALYKAKNLGRNRIVLSKNEEPGW